MSPANGTAILGAGIFAKEAHLPALGVLRGAVPPLKAVYSRSERSARDLAEAAVATLHLNEPPSVYHDGDTSSDLDALLARSDITSVIVILPITTQPGVVLKALAAGKHVLSEKPVAADVASGLELIKTYNTVYKPKGLIWRIAENFEAEPGVQAAAAAIKAGKIGEVSLFKTNVYNFIDEESKWYKTPWRTIPDYQGGFILDGGVHTIAILRTILPHPLTHLSGFASLTKEYLKPHDTIQAIAKADSHFTGIAELSWASPVSTRPLPDSTIITGTKGWLSITQVHPPEVKSSIFRVKIVSRVKVEASSAERDVEEIIDHPISGVAAEILSFFDAIAGKPGVEAFGDPLGALRDVAFIQAALDSNGQPVDLLDLVPLELPIV
ncbi:hypothetical protein AX16_005805 [Volvariella volvacea WC 439]|nr:hypothetical protein AX16_005805 [Volvariella volvacea WC 439]